MNVSKGRNGSLDEEEIPCAGPASCFSPPEWQVCWDGIGWIYFGLYYFKSFMKRLLCLSCVFIFQKFDRVSYQIVCDQQAAEAGEQFFRRWPNFLSLTLNKPPVLAFIENSDNALLLFKISSFAGCATPSSSPPQRLHRCRRT